MGETQAMKRFGARYWNKPVPNCKHLTLYTDDYWNCFIRQYTMTIYHMSGTAKMGPPTDPWAVVDPQLRVYGIPGLRVIDASIMPAITNGNIHAPVVMIGEKGADMIKQLWLTPTTAPVGFKVRGRARVKVTTRAQRHHREPSGGVNDH